MDPLFDLLIFLFGLFFLSITLFSEQNYSGFIKMYFCSLLLNMEVLSLFGDKFYLTFAMGEDTPNLPKRP